MHCGATGDCLIGLLLTQWWGVVRSVLERVSAISWTEALSRLVVR